MFFHLDQSDRDSYFDSQVHTSNMFILPYLNWYGCGDVLEVGCGEGGNLKPFLDRGCQVTGVDISGWKLSLAAKFFENHPYKNRLTLINGDIKDFQTIKKYDLIILKDVLEHIENKNVLFNKLKSLLKMNGRIFISFPPWRMPFGGHQQLGVKIPYLHLIPVYKLVLRLFKPRSVKNLMEIKKTRLSINQFNKLAKKFQCTKQTYYLINPGYESKYQLKARELPKVFNIPYLRDFYTTAVYSILKKVNDEVL